LKAILKSFSLNLFSFIDTEKQTMQLDFLKHKEITYYLQGRQINTHSDNSQSVLFQNNLGISFFCKTLLKLYKNG